MKRTATGRHGTEPFRNVSPFGLSCGDVTMSLATFGDAFALRLSKLETAPDAYFKPEWYKNWWLGDAEADVPAVVALVSEHLGCA